MKIVEYNYNFPPSPLEKHLDQNTTNSKNEDFVELIESYQGRLYGYILSLTSNPNIANDILQETNMVLWRKSSEFELGTNFKAWSFRIANFQVLSFRENRNRDKHVYDETLFENLTTEAEQLDELYEERLNALETCLKTLDGDEQSLLNRRYSEKESIKNIALSLNLKANSLTQTIIRIRKKLMACIKHKTGQL